jgi:hypothetical protein
MRDCGPQLDRKTKTPGAVIHAGRFLMPIGYELQFSTPSMRKKSLPGAIGSVTL